MRLRSIWLFWGKVVRRRSDLCEVFWWNVVGHDTLFPTLDHGFLIARFSRSVWVYHSMLVKCGLLTVQVAIVMSIKIRTSLIIVFTTFESNSTRRHGLVT